MTYLIYGSLTLVLLAVGFLVYRLGRAFRVYWRFSGKRLVTCPETHEPAAVAVAAGRVAATAATGTPHLRLRECSRWPERENCGQECLRQIEADPENCLVWNIVNAWYADKACVYCQTPFGKINWHDHRPAVLDTNGKTVQWTQVSPEKLPAVFATHWPVCWDCHIAESFRREFPELVTDRPEHASQSAENRGEKAGSKSSSSRPVDCGSCHSR